MWDGRQERFPRFLFYAVSKGVLIKPIEGTKACKREWQKEMDVIQINSGEYVGMRVLAIKSIPHISILSENLQPQEHIEHYAQDMASLLSEIYQQYKELFKQAGQSQDLSIELNWMTESVVGQPYKAKINLFVLLRCIHAVQQQIQETLEVLSGLLKATLDSGKYEYEDFSFADYYSKLHAATNGECQAIVKEERMWYLPGTVRI